MVRHEHITLPMSLAVSRWSTSLCLHLVRRAVLYSTGSHRPPTVIIHTVAHQSPSLSLYPVRPLQPGIVRVNE